MTRRRLSLMFLAAALAAAALSALAAGSASAAGVKVLLVTRNEEGEGPPATMGEPAHITNFVQWTGAGAFCGGTDEEAHVGKNPAGKVKVNGSGAPLGSAVCFAGEAVPGSITIKSVSLSSSGAVMLHGRFEIEAGGCHYRATKLTGVQSFGEEAQFSDTLSGTGKRVKAGSAPSCPATAPVEDLIGVSDSSGFNYDVKLVS